MTQAMLMPTNNPLSDIVAMKDDDIQDAVKQFALEVLTGLRKQFKAGTPQVKLQIGKALLPHIVRSLNTDGEAEEMTILKQQMADMHNAILGTQSTKLHVVNGEVITEDSPH